MYDFLIQYSELWNIYSCSIKEIDEKLKIFSKLFNKLYEK